MTFDDQMRDHRSRCRRQLSRLRMLTLAQDGMTLPPRLAAEIRDVTNAIVAETESMSRALLRAGREEPGAETFLWVRLTRLALAADQAVMAARNGDLHELRARLHHFDSLTSAIWTVQHAVHGRQLASGRGSHVAPGPRAEWTRVPPPREQRPSTAAATTADHRGRGNTA